MCLSYIGVKGGMVVLVADDPGQYRHKQNKTQDILLSIQASIFDPSSVERENKMIIDAFDYSENMKLQY